MVDDRSATIHGAMETAIRMGAMLADRMIINLLIFSLFGCFGVLCSIIVSR